VTAAFSAEVAGGLEGPEWLRRRRLGALEAFGGASMPDATQEMWRYSPIDSLDLERFAPAGTPDVPAEAPWRGTLSELTAGIAGRSGLVTVHNGFVVGLETDPRLGVTRLADPAAPEGRLGSLIHDPDPLVHLNDAFAGDGLLVEVPAHTRLAAPLVVVHWVDQPPAAGGGHQAVFSRVHVRVGEDAELSVVEVVAGDPGDALVVPVTELEVADQGHLSYVTLQTLSSAAWHLARTAGRIGADASLRLFTVSLGASYDRTRVDVVADGRGGTSEIRSAYLGSGDQVHDVRTLQDHVAERTSSDLLCKGAVTDSARSIYTGLIRVRRGAVRADAFQTNHNLVLAEAAHADSVPNLDIEENDVRCSHASTVGPVDEDQRYYVESRGIPPQQATRLIVQGFFDDIVERCPVPTATGLLGSHVASRLGTALANPSDGAPS
jgi:Fe-S cluster assembly protein SufD